jgi:hypothetical protein
VLSFAVDLFHLFKCVQSHGGYKSVCNRIAYYGTKIFVFSFKVYCGKSFFRVLVVFLKYLNEFHVNGDHDVDFIKDWRPSL